MSNTSETVIVAPSREEILTAMRDNLLAGADFSDDSTDWVSIQRRRSEEAPWEPFTDTTGKGEFRPNEALPHLVDLYEAGFHLSATMTASLSGDWDEEN